MRSVQCHVERDRSRHDYGRKLDDDCKTSEDSGSGEREERPSRFRVHGESEGRKPKSGREVVGEVARCVRQQQRAEAEHQRDRSSACSDAPVDCPPNEKKEAEDATTTTRFPYHIVRSSSV